MHYIYKWLYLYLKSLTEVCSWGSSWQEVCICSVDGLAPNKQQAITWISSDSVLSCHMLSLGHNYFNSLAPCWCHNVGLVQDCSISSVLAMEILQSCTKPSVYGIMQLSRHWLRLFDTKTVTWLAWHSNPVTCCIYETPGLSELMHFLLHIYIRRTQWVNGCICKDLHIDDLVQDCSTSIANALEILQSCTKPPISNSIMGSSDTWWIWTWIWIWIPVQISYTVFAKIVINHP